DRWAAAGWERGALGYPVGDTTCGLRDGGCFQHFQGGSVYWSPGTGARVLSVEIRDRWGAAGWENGALGFPVSDVGSLKDGGRFVHFQGGSIYWSPATGARIVSGVVRDRWAAAGWENGPLGFPVSDVTALADGGAFAHFQGGSVYWSSGTGARVLLAPVRDAWLAAGGDAGDLGMPVADAASTPDGLAQYGRFAGGAVYLHAALGGHVVPGAVVEAWDAAGGIDGVLGYPTSDAVPTADG
ncbi:LGFP repeat-containing protein, partial [Blastococcus sp. KM273129]|uniref:LGFP repeat-containing protein n=1 Tax=Blastococcus sp. KM273129 TaxID=2570315 RepID=UPI0035ABDDCC|nr:hypothetical protein [Blastococcus sp. KM273129]